MQPCSGCRVTWGKAPFLRRPGFPSLSAEVAGPPSAKPCPHPDSGSTGIEQAGLAEVWARSSGSPISCPRLALWSQAWLRLGVMYSPW